MADAVLPGRTKRQAEEEAGQLFRRAGLSPAGCAELLEELKRAARREEVDETDGTWGRFAMFAVMNTEDVWAAIDALPPKQRPQEVYRIFNYAALHCLKDTGEVTLSRDQLAAKAGCSSGSVSLAMSVLEQMGVIRRERQKVAWLKGPGRAVYFVNPHVAWNGKLKRRTMKAKEVDPPAVLSAAHLAEQLRPLLPKHLCHIEFRRLDLKALAKSTGLHVRYVSRGMQDFLDRKVVECKGDGKQALWRLTNDPTSSTITDLTKLARERGRALGDRPKSSVSIVA